MDNTIQFMQDELEKLKEFRGQMEEKQDQHDEIMNKLNAMQEDIQKIKDAIL